MLTSISFHNFRAFSKYSLALRDTNVLVGPNNSGKSTLLDSLRLLRGAYRFASRRNATFQVIEGESQEWGWLIPEGSVPISTANIHTDYNDLPTRVSFRFARGQRLHLHFPRAGQPILTADTNRRMPLTTRVFRSEFPLDLTVIPTLGPFDPDETVLDRAYVERSAQGHLAPRHFRNEWYLHPESFDEFAELVKLSWPGVTIEPPERVDLLSNRLAMFCREQSMTREVSWVGFGFQIWLQLLTQLVKSQSANVLVVDEPEIYLHPDLQRKIVAILRDHPAQIILATHSVEIINEVEVSDIVIVDKEDRTAVRLTDLEELERVVEVLGSSYNVHLTRLVRAKRVLFVEGQDSKLLSRFARAAGFRDIFTIGNLTIMPLGGFSEYRRVAHAQWTTDTMLGEDIRMMALFDRDYRCAEEVASFEQETRRRNTVVHVFARKELENYVLEPSVLERAINARLVARVERGTLETMPAIDAAQLLHEVTDPKKAEVSASYAAAKIRYMSPRGTDHSTILGEHNRQLEIEWSDTTRRIEIVPGKPTLAALNELIRQRWGVSISAGQVVSLMTREEVPPDMVAFLLKMRTHLYADRHISG